MPTRCLFFKRRNEMRQDSKDTIRFYMILIIVLVLWLSASQMDTIVGWIY